MNTVKLQQTEEQLRKAAQSLWEFRTKDGATPAVASFLESSQDSISQLLQHLDSCRQTLDGLEPI